MNTFGNKFRISIFGESHGPLVGVTLDGVQPGIPLSEEDFVPDISRRKSGGKGTTPRVEPDDTEIVSGVYEGFTSGAPLTLLFKNTNTHSADYSSFSSVPRPGHADLTAAVRFDGFNDPRGGGAFSGRLTLPVVAGGTVAKKQIEEILGTPVSFNASIVALGGVSREDAERRGGKKPDSELWDSELSAAAKEGDSLGAVVECRIEGLPMGLGNPFWDSVESLLSHAVFSIPGVRGIEFGDGFASAAMKGSRHNDPIVLADGVPVLSKNGAGGINGGITNGAPVVFRVAFKPTSSIAKAQKTLDFEACKEVSLSVPGRHDTCFALRTPVIVEAMSALVFADLLTQ